MSRGDDNISDSWEMYADESFKLEKRLEKERMINQNGLETNGNDDFKPRILQRPPKTQQQQQQIKILKRPENSSSNSSNQPQNSSKPQIKTFEQREKEYAEARKRILGSESPDQIQKQVVYNNNAVSPSASSSNLQQQVSPRTPENVIREPRGPSSTPGFRIRR